MDYEKAYKEALEQAKKELAVCGSMDCDAARLIFRLFPQLRENEDEKAIKSMTRLVKAFYDCNFPTPEGFERKDLFAWLKKQKEPKQECGERGMKGPQEIGDWRGDEGVCKKQKEYLADNSKTSKSEDEKIREVLIQYLKDYPCHLPNGLYSRDDFFTYLEKQKEQKVDIDKLRRDIYQSGYNDGYQHGKEDAQKEQKPADYNEYKMLMEGAREHGKTEGRKEVIDHPEEYGLTKQKPVGWSEEDESQLDDIEKAISNYYDLNHAPQYHYWLEEKLKSFRPQSKDEIYKEKDEAFKLGKHQLAIKFMNYLDENMPESKMSLSNGECEDIDKAFKENDWNKIIRYIEKYKPHWKPSKEQMDALNALNCHGDLSYVGQQGYLISLYNDLKKLM